MQTVYNNNSKAEVIVSMYQAMYQPPSGETADPKQGSQLAVHEALKTQSKCTAWFHVVLVWFLLSDSIADNISHCRLLCMALVLAGSRELPGPEDGSSH